MAYILNEDGFRDRMHGRSPATIADQQAATTAETAPEGPPGPGEARPSEGRPSVGRTSLGRTSLGRTSAGRPNIGRTSVQVSDLRLRGLKSCMNMY